MLMAISGKGEAKAKAPPRKQNSRNVSARLGSACVTAGRKNA